MKLRYGTRKVTEGRDSRSGSTTLQIFLYQVYMEMIVFHINGDAGMMLTLFIIT